QKAFERVLEHHGISPKNVNPEDIRIVGVTAKQNIKNMKSKHRLEPSIDELLDLRSSIYDKLLDEGVEPMPGLRDLIKSLKQNGIKIGVASSATRENIEKVLKMIGLDNTFDIIVSGAEVKNSKPAPDVFLKAAQDLDVNPSNCIVLEDAYSGVIAGKAAGSTVIAIPNKYTINDDFSEADHIFRSLTELDFDKIQKLIK
ncbi:HAD family phosphatase, partial [Candidatus Saccharibacteria bacterium]|nr:HAD family phosphatase [Candidatus Saccharibacteria bacterium]